MLKNLLRLILIAAIVFPIGNYGSVRAQSQAVQYLSPVPGSIYNPPGSTIAIRFGDTIAPGSISTKLFTISGSASGLHDGQVVLADDQKTLIYKPDSPFTLGESVQVDLRPGIASMSNTIYSAVSFSFSISTTDPSSPQVYSALKQLLASEYEQANPSSAGMNSATSNYVTTPYDFPKIFVATSTSGAMDGYIFSSDFNVRSFFGYPNVGSYLLILDNQGEPVYYQKVPETTIAMDFKKLGNGLLAYWEAGVYHLLDTNYKEVKTVASENGYPPADGHDFLLLPNGHYLLMIYNPLVIDMSKVVPGGKPNATVIECVIQEEDAQGNVVFQWNSIDKIPVTDSNQDLTTATVDYIHSNAFELDNDGNILLSSRHLDEITKINHQTGDVIWRLGGKANQFTLSSAAGISETPQFYFQHDIRRLVNGDISLFDNHNNHDQQFSRGLEFSLDELNKTAKLVWAYRNTPDVMSGFMGNVQHLSNGNTIIGWGGVSNPNITEVLPDGTKVLEMGFDTAYLSYRGYKYTWHGLPTWAPTLVIQPETDALKLTFSWNGATDITKYKVFAGKSPQNMAQIAQVLKTGFETSVSLVGTQMDYCFYQILPVDADDQKTMFSNPVINPDCPTLYVPVVAKSGH